MTTLDALHAHRLWAPSYDVAPNPLLGLESRIVAGLLPPLAGLRVVDVAAGTGRWARFAAKHGALTISTDLCPEMLQRAPKPAVLADSTQLPLRDEIADVTICAFAYAYMPPCLSELERITRIGGLIIVSDMHPAASERGWTRSFRHVDQVIEISHRRYSLEEVRKPGAQITEASFGEPERVIFDRADRTHLFDDTVPAIFVAQWVRV